MAAIKKELYVASDVEELKAKWSDVEQLIKKKSNTQILSSAKKLLDSGNEHFKNGDEENAFVIYGRYMNILVQIQKRNTVEATNYMKSVLGGREGTHKIMTRLEELTESLNQRYNEKNMKMYPEIPAEETLPAQPTQLQESQGTRHSISCLELYSMMEKESSKFIILDCRSQEDYDRSKIVFNFTCNVPETLCCIGMTASKVENNLPNESQVVWRMRKSRPITVFVDWFSTSFIRNSPIWHLKTILTDWDEDYEGEKTPEIILLEGGFERWLVTYPMKCSDPHVKAPNENKITAPTMNFEYPNIEDIVMKDDTKKTPTVDRSTKGNAMRNYEDNLSQTDLLHKKIDMLEKSIQNDQELMMLEDQYLSSNKENEEENSQVVLYKIMELQAKQKDTKVETDKIDMDLEITRNLPSQPSESSKLKSVEDEVKRKEIEAKSKAEELSIKQRHRSEMLERARANKPNFDMTPIKTPRKSELILTPRNLNSQSIPSVNRASKPATYFNSSQKDYDNQDFSPVYGRVDRGLTGLKNLGNTCYMNSILQCLSNTFSLTHFILEGAYEKYINRETKGQVVRTLAALIKMLWRGDCKYISSKHLKEVIGKQADLFYGCEQQDAHEFLILLIDWLQSDLQTIHMPLDYSENASEKAWLEYTKAKESYILRLFYGQIKSTLKCTVCGEESATFDTFSNLSLELPPSEIDSCKLEHCFNSYFHGERISGWNCPKCKAPRDAVKKLDISKLPPVLIIHLKRFYADPNFSCSSYKKKTCKVDFPLERLDMLGYVAPKERANIAASARPYKLYAVSNHYGTLESGHYTAFCFNTTKKRWYKFDDQSVSSIDTSEVISSSAYVLFYTNLHENNYNMN